MSNTHSLEDSSGSQTAASSLESNENAEGMVEEMQGQLRDQFLKALRKTEERNLSGSQILAERHPATFKELRDTHTEVMQRSGTDASEWAENWNALMDVMDSAPRAQVKETAATLLGLLQEQKREPQKDGANRKRRTDTDGESPRPSKAIRNSDSSSTTTSSSKGSKASKGSESTNSNGSEPKTFSKKSKEPLPNRVDTLVVNLATNKDLLNHNAVVEALKMNKPGDDKGPKIVASHLLSQKAGHALTKEYIVVLARQCFPLVLASLADDQVFDELVKGCGNTPSKEGEPSSFEDDEIWDSLGRLAEVTKYQTADNNTMLYFHHAAEFGNASWLTMHNIIYNRTLTSLGFDPNDKEWTRELKLANQLPSNKGKHPRGGGSGQGTGRNFSRGQGCITQPRHRR